MRHLAGRVPGRPADRPATAACRDSGRASRALRRRPDWRWTRCRCPGSASGSSSGSRCAGRSRGGPASKMVRRPVSRGCRPSAFPALSVPICSTLPAGTASVGPARVVVRVGVGNQRAERVVAAAQVQDDEVAADLPLRQREVGQERRRREADREGGDAAAHELAPGDRHDGVPWPHTNWYSADPTIRCTRPGALVASCASEPVHVAAGAQVVEQRADRGRRRSRRRTSRSST